MKVFVASRAYRMMRAALLSSVAVASSSAALAQDASAATEQSGGVQDIVVTAQKREQNLQDVPISITALGADTIAANRIQDVRDLSGIAPNLTVRPSAGGNNAPNYSMRGIFTNGSAVGVDKGIAMYIDGVYVQASSGSIFELANLERIEVLKGPQGTLFGRNATAGAISIITKNPTGEFGVQQEFSYGNKDQLRSKTSVDLPKIGPVSASFSYLHSERRGDVRNLGAGTVWDYSTTGEFGKRKSPKYLGDQNVEAFFAALDFDLHPDLDLTYKFDFSQNRYTPEASGVSFLTPAVAGLYNALVPADEQTPITNSRPKAVNNWFSTPSYNRVYGHNVTAQYRVNDEISIKNIFGYRATKNSGTFQLDGLGGIIAPPGGIPTQIPGLSVPGGYAYALTANNVQAIEKQWSNEFQINVSTDGFNLTAGYLHFQDKFASAGFQNTFNTYVGAFGFGGFAPQADGSYLVPTNARYRHSRVKAISDAWFVQPEFHLTEQLDLVLGARLTKDKKTGIEYAPVQPAAPAPVRSTRINYKESRPSFLAGLNFQATPDILTYAKFATGYVSGGQLATIAFEPETAKSWEAGIKADLFDRRFRSNLAIFHVKYKNIQYTTSGQITGVPSAAAFSQAVISSADGRAYGFEWENTVVPFDGLTLTGNLGYTNFKFDDDTVFNGADPTVYGGFVRQSGAPGYQEFSRPKWTGNVSAQYETGELFMGGHLVARMDANYRSKALLTSNLTIGNSTATTLAPEYPGLREAATAKAYWLVNGRLALAEMDVAGTKAHIALWGRNIFNSKRITQYVGLNAYGPVLYERARTYGLDVGFEF